MDGECRTLVDKCKAEAKGLVEVTATRRKIHWTHPAFTSFCVSVEDILSYQVKRRHRGNKTITPSGRILRELSKSFPIALDVYNKAFSGSKEGKQDYSTTQTSSATERKVLWIRVALVEGSLANIVEQLVRHPSLFYDDKAVLCHPVYSQVFQSLIDGPCSIRYSRLKFSDGGYNTLSPSELVHRHKKVLTIAASNGDTAGASERAWGHVQSMYQSNNATCLFGKNNILVKPPSAPSPLRGYLTLQQSAFGELQLKWIPNCLLNSSVASSGLWDQVIAVAITQEIAHIHCHRAQGCSAEMLLIGYDGIAYPPLLFPHQPSLFLFLECLENSLLPKGCLEPPLWYLKQSSKSKASTNHTHSPCDDEDMDAWNQVFRIRYGGSKDTATTVSRGIPPSPLPLTVPPYSSTAQESSSSSESEGEEPVAMEITSAANWESFQSEVSKQLLARHFYSWLSHCRHMIKVRHSVAHLVSSTIVHPRDVTDDVTKGSPLSEREWAEFSQLSSSERGERWGRVLRRVYLCGVEHSIRAQVWPTLLGVYPVTSTHAQRKDILSTITASYKHLMTGWRRSEVTHRELTRAAEDSRENSPSLSSISPSPPSLSPRHHSNDNVPLSPCRHGDDDAVSMATQVIAELEALGVDSDGFSRDSIPPMSCDYIQPMSELDERGEKFLQNLYNIDKDIPRCDRDYWYFKSAGNLLKVRNIVCTYVWDHLSEGYSQGMCDLLAPILVATDNEPLAYACYLKLMEQSSQLFPPSSLMNTRLGNLKALLQVMEPDYHAYLTQRPMGDGFFYCYRWLLVCFKREFSYEDLFRIWECVWVARLTVSQYFEEFLALAIMKQFQSAIMDAHLDPSDILNLFTELADKHKIDCDETIRTAIAIIHKLQEDLAVK